MSLADIKTHLEKEAKNNDKLDYQFVVDEINSSVKTEKEKGVKAVNKRNDENKGLRPFKKAFVEELGFDPDEGDLSDFVSDLKSKIKNGENGKKAQGDLAELTSKFSKLEGSFNKLQGDFKKKDQEAADYKSRSERATIISRLSKDLEDRIYGADEQIKVLIADGKVGLNSEGKPVFKDGDDEIEYQKGLDAFLESRKDIAKNTQKPGSGSGGGNGKGKGEKSMSKAEFDAMPYKERAAYMADGGTVYE